MNQQQAHEFALSYAKLEYRRASDYQLQEDPMSINIHDSDNSLQVFAEFYSKALKEAKEL